MASLFQGPDSLRVKSERRRLALTIIFLAPILGVVGFFFQNTFTVRSLVLLLVGAMLFVSLSRGRLLGGGVRMGPGQFEHVYNIVVECAQLIGIPMPHVFVRDDPFVPIVAVGTGHPYALVISSQYVEAFSDDELRFLVGRELGHIAAGHAKLTSLLSVNGRENAFVAATFGAWLRIIEYSADRAGLLCCGSLTTAVSAIAVSTFHHAGRKIDLHAFAEQRREIDVDSSLRLGEWIGATPYATNRIARLGEFARDPLYLRWSAWFMERRAAPAASATPLGTDDPRRFAGPWRRAAAFGIDFLVISFLMPNQQNLGSVSVDDDDDDGGKAHVVVNGHNVSITHTSSAAHAAAAVPTPPPSPPPTSDLPSSLNHVIGMLFPGVHITFGDGLDFLVLFGYTLVLVGFVGQTLGMIIMDLRVVCVGRDHVGFKEALWRYVCFWFSFAIVIGVFGLFARIQPFERWSRTRLSNSGGSRN